VKEDAEFCLIAKDPHGPLKEKLKQNPVPGLVKVLGMTKLRKNFKTYEARRKLAAR
jgi:ribosome biogenesis protein UTP30